MPNCSVPAFTRGETPHWTYPCGCQASALRLAYCPLHAAAAEMRDALVAIVGRMESELHWPRTMTRSREYVTTINIARAVLAKVKP